MLELKSNRARRTNFRQACKNIVDTYPNPVHGLQKDAIQNSLDARAGSSEPVKVEFKVVKTNIGVFLTITDQNTTGLTGDVLNQTDDDNLKKDDHWARFESFGDTKSDDDALGSRGQGKFLFIYSSKEDKMFYDTLRKDGVYRLGGTGITQKGDSPILPPHGEEPWENDVGRQRLEKYCGLTPLAKVGTRVIIFDPKDEVLAAIKNGDFKRAIQETWFRAIEKKQLEVIINIGDKPDVVDLSFPYPLPEKEAKKHKTWILGENFKDREIKLSSGKKYKIKKFHAVYFGDEDVPEEYRGISLVQNGMKIVSEEMDMAPREVKEKISGYIEFDRDLERELRKGENQHPNHYDLRWKHSLPRALRQFVRKQLKDFGEQKLGLSKDPREQKKHTRTTAEKKAMEDLQKYAKNLNLFGFQGLGPGGSGKKKTTPPRNVEIGVLFEEFSFSDKDKMPRVDWGEEIKVGLKCFNKTDKITKCKVSLMILYGSKVIDTLLDKESIVLQNKELGKSIDIKTPIIKIEKPLFEKEGEYRVKATLIDSNNGMDLHSTIKRFWVQTNPPSRQFFKFQPSDFGEEQQLSWFTEEGDGLVLNYNIAHPEYRLVEDDLNRQSEYLFKIGLEGAIDFILNRPQDNDANYEPLDTDAIVKSDQEEMPRETYRQIMEYVSEVRWRYYKNGD